MRRPCDFPYYYYSRMLLRDMLGPCDEMLQLMRCTNEALMRTLDIQFWEFQCPSLAWSTARQDPGLSIIVNDAEKRKRVRILLVGEKVNDALEMQQYHSSSWGVGDPVPQATRRWARQEPLLNSRAKVEQQVESRDSKIPT